MDLSLPQALNLVNGKTISDAVADPKGRSRSLVAGTSDEALVEEIYLATLSRPPTKAELGVAIKYILGGRGNPGSGSAVGSAEQQRFSVQLLEAVTKERKQSC